MNLCVLFDSIAQLVEHLPFKERVLGSSPSQVTHTRGKFCLAFFFVPLLTHSDTDAPTWGFGESGNRVFEKLAFVFVEFPTLGRCPLISILD